MQRRKGAERPTLPPNEAVARRAVRSIEANLFSDLQLTTVAGQAFSSSSTLLRHFRAEIGPSPHAYIKARRLEEARRLIEAGTHPVGNVAMLVSYENFGAFSTAFKRHLAHRPRRSAIAAAKVGHLDEGGVLSDSRLVAVNLRK